jgi:hypothetical protein
MTSPRISLLALILVAVAALPARADDASVQPLVDEARALYERADLAGALAKFEEAYAKDPRPDIAFAMARIHFDRGDCKKALPLYTKFLESKPGPKSTQLATQKIAECQRLITTLDPDGGSGDKPPVDGGADEPTPPVTDEPPVAIDPDPPVEPTYQRVRQPWYTDILGDVLVVGGLVAGGVGTYFWRAALADADDANADGVTLEEYRSLHDRAEERQTYALVAGGSAVALVVAGVLRYALADRYENVEVTPLATDTDGSVGLTTGLQLEVGF